MDAPLHGHDELRRERGLDLPPELWLTFSLDYALYGLEPRGYHVTNLIFSNTACGPMAASLVGRPQRGGGRRLCVLLG